MVCNEKRRARCLAHNHRHSQGWLGLATILTAIARLVEQMCLHHHQRKWSRFIITEEGISLPNVSVGSQFHCTGFAKHPIMPTPLGLTSSRKLCVHTTVENQEGWVEDVTSLLDEHTNAALQHAFET